MINIEKLHKMYEGIIDGSELLTKDLHSFGFTKKEINELLKKGLLVRVQRGIYDITSVDNLFLYGIDLKNNGDKQRSLQCIKKCYEIDPTNIQVCLRLFKEALLDGKIEEAVSYIKEIKVIDFINNGKYYEKTMYKLYLYILNEITELPSEYKKVVDNLTYEDVKLSYNEKLISKQKEYIKIENKIRKAILERKNHLALNLLDDLYQKRIKNDITLLLLYKLLKIVKNKDKDFELIDEKCKLLRQTGGIILLSDEEITDKTEHYIKENYEDITMFEIGDTNNRKIVLRFISKKIHMDYIKYFTIGKTLFKDKKYRESIEHFKKLLSVGTPNSNIYNLIGLSYLGINEPKNAIPYLIVATELNKKEPKPYKGRYDYTKLVEMIELRIKEAIDLKQNPMLSGTHNIDKINDYIILTGLDVETSCKCLGLREEEINIALLTFAKEYYVRGNIKKGEEYLSMYNKRKTTLQNDKLLYEEIQQLITENEATLKLTSVNKINK